MDEMSEAKMWSLPRTQRRDHHVAAMVDRNALVPAHRSIKIVRRTGK